MEGLLEVSDGEFKDQTARLCSSPADSGQVSEGRHRVD